VLAVVGLRLGGPEARLKRGALLPCPISLYSPSIKYNVHPLESFTLSLFDKMLGSWYPEFVHIHVFMGILETINNNQEENTKFVLNFILLTARA